MSPKKTAIKYAEEDLGVQSVYESAQEAQKRYEAARGELVGMRRTRRHIEQMIADREADIAMQIFKDGAGASQAAVERHTKLEINTDDPIRILRTQLREVLDDIDAEETNAALAKAQIEIETARLTELGGYLHFLAEAKRAASASGPVVRTSPW